jgi:hypothetical protein
MGTISDWLWVLFLGAFWGGLMVYWNTRMEKAGATKWPLSFPHILSLSLLSLWFGIMARFDWKRAFHAPLVFITSASFIGAIVVGLLAKRSARKALAEEN